MQRCGGGIVHTSSSLGERANPLMFSYVATKHAVVGMTRSAAMDFAAQNIRVNALLPGCIETPMLHAGAQGIGLPSADTFAQFPPAKRLGQPEEPAALVTFLCSDRAAYINGIAIAVDGGLSAKFI